MCGLYSVVYSLSMGGRQPILGADAPVKELYESGLSLEEVGKRLGIGRDAIWKWLIRHNVPRRRACVTLQRPESRRYGAEHAGWIGDNVGYEGRHGRVYKARGSAAGPCTHCGTMKAVYRFEWAQLHGTTGTAPEHYIQLCKLCHEDYDAKITAEQADEIRALRFFGVKQVRLAEMYGVSTSYMSSICRGNSRARREGCER